MSVGLTARSKEARELDEITNFEQKDYSVTESYGQVKKVIEDFASLHTGQVLLSRLGMNARLGCVPSRHGSFADGPSFRFSLAPPRPDA